MALTIRAEVLAAAGTVGAKLAELSREEGDGVRTAAAQKFARGEQHWLWERYEDAVSVQDASAWTWIGEYVANQEVIMFFNAGDDKAVFVFVDGAQVVAVLRESYHFEFYLTDRALTYLLSFNHHDVLSALGVAEGWLLARRIAEKLE